VTERPHHQTLMESLMGEMERLAPHSHRSASFIQKGWHLFDDDYRRKYLRMMVDTLRQVRRSNDQFDRRRGAALLELGVDGLIEIYSLDPDVALTKARETLFELSTTKASLVLLDEMGLVDSLRRGFDGVSDEQRAALEHLQEGHRKLRENLETVLAAGGTVLLACLSRAGGATLGDEERRQMREAWARLQTSEIS
jgi:hypothetical protein